MPTAGSSVAAVPLISVPFEEIGMAEVASVLAPAKYFRRPEPEPIPVTVQFREPEQEALPGRP